MNGDESGKNAPTKAKQQQQQRAAAASPRPADSFEDEQLRDYPARKIVGSMFAIEQYEMLVNKTLAKIAAGQEKMHSAVKGLVRLAYNTLMDPTSGDTPLNDLFFHKHKRFEADWLSLAARANKKEKLEDKDKLVLDNENLPKIQLIRPGATVNQRKAAIGVWAACHLRAMVHPKDWLHRFFAKKDTPSEIIEEIYKFESPYSFPSFDCDTYELLRVEFSRKPKCDPEVLYLFYRGAIILEHIWHQPQLRPQKTLLLRVAYGNPNGLRYHGLELYNWLISAARGLRISPEQLSSDLTWALSDGPYNERARQSVETAMKLLDFHRKYNSEESKSKLTSDSSSATDSNGSSKYFMYARVVDSNFFCHLDEAANEELCSVLVEICRNKGEGYIPQGKVSALWRERGELLAQKICKRHEKQVVTSGPNQKAAARESRPTTRKDKEGDAKKVAPQRGVSDQRPNNKANRAPSVMAKDNNVIHPIKGDKFNHKQVTNSFNNYNNSNHNNKSQQKQAHKNNNQQKLANNNQQHQQKQANNQNKHANQNNNHNYNNQQKQHVRAAIQMRSQEFVSYTNHSSAHGPNFRPTASGGSTGASSREAPYGQVPMGSPGASAHIRAHSATNGPATNVNSNYAAKNNHNARPNNTFGQAKGQNMAAQKPNMTQPVGRMMASGQVVGKSSDTANSRHNVAQNTRYVGRVIAVPPVSGPAQERSSSSSYDRNNFRDSLRALEQRDKIRHEYEFDRDSKKKDCSIM